MIVLVTGGRNYSDFEWLETVLGWLPITTLAEGCARGADRLAELWAFSRGVECWHFPADWHRYGLAAGPIRNEQMLVKAQPDLVVAFPGSRGTADMIQRAEKAGVRVLRA